MHVLYNLSDTVSHSPVTMHLVSIPDIHHKE